MAPKPFEDTQWPLDGEKEAAYRVGKRAFREGQLLEDNPYEGHPKLEEAWELGWITQAETPDTTQT